MKIDKKLSDILDALNVTHKNAPPWETDARTLLELNIIGFVDRMHSPLIHGKSFDHAQAQRGKPIQILMNDGSWMDCHFVGLSHAGRIVIDSEYGGPELVHEHKLRMAPQLASVIVKLYENGHATWKGSNVGTLRQAPHIGGKLLAEFPYVIDTDSTVNKE